MQHAVEGAVDLNEGRDVLVAEFEVGLAGEMGEIGGIAGELIIHPQHAMPGAKEAVNQVRSEEPCRPGYEDAHPSGRPMLS